MARRDSDPLDPLSSSSRTTTLESTETYGTSGVSGTSGATSWQRAGQESAENGRSTAAQVKDQAKGLASEAKEEVLGAASQAREHVQSLVGARKDRAAEQLGSFAGSLRDAARKLDDGDGGATALGRYANTAAEQVDRVAQYLRDRDLQTFVRDAETFARRHPDVFLGGTFIAGMVLARFFKASDRRRGGELAGDWQSEGTYTPSRGAYGTSYGNPSYGSTSNLGTVSGSTYQGERSERAGTPGGPVPPVGG